MGLVYLITGLPRLVRGEKPPLSRADLVRRCRSELEGRDLAEFERLMRYESVEETVRLALAAQLDDPDASPATLNAAVLVGRNDVARIDELPAWLRRPLQQHRLLQRHYFELTRGAKTRFLKDWANFIVDVEEVKTAILCRNEGVDRDAFVAQMQGSFDASAPMIINNWDDPFLGLQQRFSWLPAVIDAFEDEDLLRGEQAISEILWARVDALHTAELFSVETVLAYYLRLRILERSASWDADKGREILDQILSIPADTAASTPAG
ncbi:MAG: DUF2764 family protein [Myxococcales bacterium]|nr:DUF2764 family protein [Myxococcales bacterium]